MWNSNTLLTLVSTLSIFFGTSAPCAAQLLVNGAGATFPYPIYSKWFSEYHKLHPDVRINYQSIGSGAGIRQITRAPWTLAQVMAR